MKILHVNTHDFHGGAARAAYHLHKALLKQGEQSILYVMYKSTNENEIIQDDSQLYNMFNQFVSRLKLMLFRRSYNPSAIFSFLRKKSTNLHKIIKKTNPDIVHLHWVN